MKIFVVVGSMYDDSWLVAAYSTRDAADAHCKLACDFETDRQRRLDTLLKSGATEMHYATYWAPNPHDKRAAAINRVGWYRVEECALDAARAVP